MDAELSIQDQIDCLKTTDVVLAILDEMRKMELARTIVVSHDDFQHTVVIFSAAIILDVRREKGPRIECLDPDTLDLYYKCLSDTDTHGDIVHVIARNVIAKITTQTNDPKVSQIDPEKIPTPYSFLQIIENARTLESVVTSAMGPAGG